MDLQVTSQGRAGRYTPAAACRPLEGLIIFCLSEWARISNSLYLLFRDLPMPLPSWLILLNSYPCPLHPLFVHGWALLAPTPNNPLLDPLPSSLCPAPGQLSQSSASLTSRLPPLSHFSFSPLVIQTLSLLLSSIPVSLEPILTRFLSPICHQKHFIKVPVAFHVANLIFSAWSPYSILW